MQYLIPAILSIIGGLILWAIKRERMSLTYEIVKSEVFPRENTSGRYFVCTLRNTGNRPIENITYTFRVSDGQIESVKFSNSQLIQLSAQDRNAIEGSIALLNPKEEIGAVVTITDASQKTGSTLEARAVGATAHEKTNESIPEYLNIILLAATLGAAATTGFSMWTSYRQSEMSRSFERIGNVGDIAKAVAESEKNLEELVQKTTALEKKANRFETEFEQGHPEREHQVFAILNKSGLGFILPTLLATGDELPYWKTGLYIMHVYLTDKKYAKKYVDALDQLSRTEAIVPSSKGFLLYLAGKIEQDQGNSKKAIEYLERCKKETPLMYDHLMAQDPAYDLRALERVITSTMSNKPIKPTR